eukprot:gene11513-5022_t
MVVGTGTIYSIGTGRDPLRPLRWRSRAGCGAGAVVRIAACKNDKTYRDPYFGARCPDWVGFCYEAVRNGMMSTAQGRQLLRRCPRACGLCPYGIGTCVDF